jgi:hypothetical protein
MREGWSEHGPSLYLHRETGTTIKEDWKEDGSPCLIVRTAYGVVGVEMEFDPRPLDTLMEQAEEIHKAAKRDHEQFYSEDE